MKKLFALLLLLIPVIAFAGVNDTRLTKNQYILNGKVVRVYSDDENNFGELYNDGTNTVIGTNTGQVVTADSFTVAGDGTLTATTGNLTTLSVSGTSTLSGVTTLSGTTTLSGSTSIGNVTSLTVNGTTTSTGAVLNRVSLTQADLTGTCTTGDMRIDNANTRELCICVNSNSFMCFKQDATGPFD